MTDMTKAEVVIESLVNRMNELVKLSDSDKVKAIRKIVSDSAPEERLLIRKIFIAPDGKVEVCTEDFKHHDKLLPECNFTNEVIIDCSQHTKVEQVLSIMSFLRDKGYKVSDFNYSNIWIKMRNDVSNS
jgi:hypothetical protein